jgi:hypothetical protein
MSDPAPKPPKPVLTFRVPQSVADELGRLVAAWQGAFTAALQYEQEHPDFPAQQLLFSRFNTVGTGATTWPLSEGSIVVSALCEQMKRYADLIKHESALESLAQGDSTVAALAMPLRMWALVHPHAELWGDVQAAAALTKETATRRARTVLRRGGAFHGTRRSQRAAVRSVVVPQVAPATNPTLDGLVPPT